jgi:hypothetical protein
MFRKQQVTGILIDVGRLLFLFRCHPGPNGSYILAVDKIEGLVDDIDIGSACPIPVSSH